MIGANIRSFFEDLFGSRLVRQLREDLLFARSETERVRKELNQVIVELRNDKQQLYAKLSSYEARVGIKTSSVAPTKPSFADWATMPAPETTWQKMVREKEEENARLNAEEEKVPAATVLEGQIKNGQ